MRKRMKKVALLTGVGATAIVNAAPTSIVAQEIESNTESNNSVVDSADSVTAAEMEGTDLYIDESTVQVGESQESSVESDEIVEDETTSNEIVEDETTSNEIVEDEMTSNEIVENESTATDSSDASEENSSTDSASEEEAQDSNEILSNETTGKEDLNSAQTDETSEETASSVTAQTKTQPVSEQDNSNVKASSKVGIDALGLSVSFMRTEDLGGGKTRYWFSLNSKVPVGLPEGLTIHVPNKKPIVIDASYVNNKKKNYTGFYELSENYVGDKSLIIVEFNGERREFHLEFNQSTFFQVNIQFKSISGRELPESLKNQEPGVQLVEGYQPFELNQFALTDGTPLEKGKTVYIEKMETGQGNWMLESVEIPELHSSDDGIQSLDQDITVICNWSLSLSGTAENVFYRFRSDDQFKELPEEVNKLLPPNYFVMENNRKIEPTMPSETTVRVEDGVWTFTEYNPDSIIFSSWGTEIFEFVGTWHFEEKTTVQITYDDGVDDTVTNMPDPQEVDTGSKIRLSDKKPVRNGYVFTGWSYDNQMYQPNDEFTVPDTNVTFTAQWEEDRNNNGTPDENETLTIQFDGGLHGSIVGTTEFKVIPGESYPTAPEVIVTNEDYEFKEFRDLDGNPYSFTGEVPDGQKTETLKFTAHYVICPEVVVSIPSLVTLSEDTSNLGKGYAGQSVTATFDSQRGDGYDATLSVDESFELEAESGSGETLTVKSYNDAGQELQDVDGDGRVVIGTMNKTNLSLKFWLNTIKGKYGEKYKGKLVYYINLLQNTKNKGEE